MKRIFLALLLSITLSSCAEHPDKIAAADVSPLQYQGYSCKQIGAEIGRVQRKVNDLYFRLDKTASNDDAQMGIGLILFWPALFFLDGKNSPEAAEYARLRGEADALEEMSIKKNCGFKIETITVKKTTTVPKKKNNFRE